MAYRVAGHADLLVAAHVGLPADVALATAGVAEARLSVERAEHAVALLQRLVRRAKNRGVQASASHTNYAMIDRMAVLADFVKHD